MVAKTPDPLEVKLAEYAESASRSLRVLAQAEADAAQQAPSREVRSSQTVGGQMVQVERDAPPALERVIALTWTGPVEDLVAKVATEAGYRVEVIGRRPPLPVVASVATTRASLYDVLMDVGHQVGRHASIIVRPSAKEIQVRYAVTVAKAPTK